MTTHNKSASIALFLPEVLSFFCHLPSAICLVSTMQLGINPDLVSFPIPNVLPLRVSRYIAKGRGQHFDRLSDRAEGMHMDGSWFQYFSLS
jgi:hypothetical protein